MKDDVKQQNNNYAKLTQKQETFCLKYFESGNASKAALIAGYSKRSIRAIASINLTKANVIQRIAELRQIAEDATIASALERKQVLTEIARGNLMDYQETGADGAWLNIGSDSPHTKAIAEITSRTNEDNSVITRVKLHNPIQAIAELNKMDGIYEGGNSMTIGKLNVIVNVQYEDINKD